MREPRTALAASLLAAGARLHGTPLTAQGEAFQAARARLADAGVGADHVVGLLDLPPQELLLSMVAAWNLDAVAWPLQAGHPVDRCSFVLDAQGHLRSVSGLRCPELHDVAMLHNTSGSTATAKTALRSVASVFAEMEGYRAGLALKPHDRVAVPIPVSHSLGSGVAVTALLSGCDVHATARRLPSAIAGELDTGRVDKAVLTPTVARLLVQTRRGGTAVPKCVLIGAGVVSDELALGFLERFGLRATCGYGSTETGGTFLGPAGIGAPMAGVEVVSPAAGAEGELVLQMPTAVRGYLDAPHGGGRIWRTGDVVRRDDTGHCHFLKRSGDDRVRLDGRFVDLQGVAQVLQATPGVKEHVALVLGDGQRLGAEALCILVATEGLAAPDLARMLPSLPGNVTARVVTCAALPRTPIGKLDREAAMQLVARHG